MLILVEVTIIGGKDLNRQSASLVLPIKSNTNFRVPSTSSLKGFLDIHLIIYIFFKELFWQTNEKMLLFKKNGGIIYI